MGYKMSEFKNNSLYDRINKLLVSYEWSDCSFSVSGKTFKAHKLILGISSPVFEAMFYGPLSSDDDITITDIEPHIFQLLLNYIYTDKVEISSIEEAYELLYVAKKYLLEHLTHVCIAYVKSNISIDNVISVLNYPDYMQENQLLSDALQLFCEHATYLLQENKSNISHSCMQKILKCQDMNITEKDLIKIVFEWTSSYWEQNNLAMDLKSRRNVLIQNGMFQLLRFNTLSFDEFDEILNDKNNILLSSEVENIRQAIKSNKQSIKNNLIMSTIIPRNSINMRWYLCHRSPLRSASPVIIDSRNHYINCRIKANKTTFINSFNIPSRMMPVIDFCNSLTTDYCEKFSVSIINDCNNSIITNNNFKKTVVYDSSIDIDFSEPLLIKKDNWYKICFMWPQPSTFDSYSYAMQCRDTYYDNNKIGFEFEDLFTMSNNGGSFLISMKYCM